MITELQKACSRADVGAPSLMIDLVDFAFRRFSDPVTGDVSSNDPLRRNAELPEPKKKFDRLLAQLSGVSSECDT